MNDILCLYSKPLIFKVWNLDCGLVFGCFDPKDGIFGNSNVLGLKNAKNGNIGCFVTLKNVILFVNPIKNQRVGGTFLKFGL